MSQTNSGLLEPNDTDHFNYNFQSDTMDLLKNYENRQEKRALMQRNKRTAHVSNTTGSKADSKCSNFSNDNLIQE